MVQTRKKSLLGALCIYFCVVGGIEEKRSISEIIYAQKFLKQYHYLSPLKDGNHDWKTAVEMYQDFMHLPATGKLDDNTFKEMNKPRCGIPDIEEEDDDKKISKRFGVSAKAWNKTQLTYSFESYCQDMPKSLCESVIAKAFKLWSDSSVLRFTKVADVKTADIKIAFVTGTHLNCQHSFNGQNNVLAHALFPRDGGLHFNEAHTFTDGTSSGTNLYSVAVHEIGHVIGISHQPFIKSAIMYPTYKGYNPNLKLHSDDIHAVAYLYAGGTASPQMITQSPTCVDTIADCAKSKNLCQIFKSVMATTCKFTCNFCPADIPNSLTCTNEYREDWCKYFKARQRCYSSIVMKKCRKTCDRCDQPAVAGK